MTALFADRLMDAVRRVGSPLCTGFDVFPEKISALFGDARHDIRAVLRFGEAFLELAAPRAGVFKPQLGLLECYGAEGMVAAGVLSEMAQTAGMVSILDAKRGDIGTTAEGYARAALGPRPCFDADAVTVSPYLGLETIEPFIKLAQERAKGVAVLVRTSNPGARDLQDLRVMGDQPVWSRVADLIAPHLPRLEGSCGWSGLMAVAGATYPQDARILRAILPNSLFLVPGFGAQGATAEEAVAGFVATSRGLEGGVVNASRSVLYPEASLAAGTIGDWRAAIVDALESASRQLALACAPR